MFSVVCRTAAPGGKRRRSARKKDNAEQASAAELLLSLRANREKGSVSEGSEGGSEPVCAWSLFIMGRQETVKGEEITEWNCSVYRS